jgi:hypothetical protein
LLNIIHAVSKKDLVCAIELSEMLIARLKEGSASVVASELLDRTIVTQMYLMTKTSDALDSEVLLALSRIVKSGEARTNCALMAWNSGDSQLSKEKALIWYGVALSLLDPNDTGNAISLLEKQAICHVALKNWPDAREAALAVARIAGKFDVLAYVEVAEGETGKVRGDMVYDLLSKIEGSKWELLLSL